MSENLLSLQALFFYRSSEGANVTKAERSPVDNGPDTTAVEVRPTHFSSGKDNYTGTHHNFVRQCLCKNAGEAGKSI
jgi:hypothetical protein